MDLETMVCRAFWLTRQQQKIIEDSMAQPTIQGMPKKDQIKLLGVLCSIPYAEAMIRRHGKFFLTKMEKILERVYLKKLFCRTFGTWNFHICHAKKFEYSQNEFKEILQNDSHGINFVIEFIVKDIGLCKPANHIFAEYQHNVMATTVVAMQRTLNFIMKKYDIFFSVDEDGLIGDHTLKALKLCEKKLQISFSIKTFSEKEIHSFLDQITKREGIEVRPFIPQLRIKMNFSYVKKILSKSLSQPSQLKKLRLIFYNHIDVPLYVSHGMQAYLYLIY